jgi:hypothetical protein
VVLVVSTGKVFDPIREFLKSFEHPRNPLPWVADLISCSMCSGVWIGALWGLAHSWSWGVIVVFSGLLSLLSFVANEALGLIGILTLRVSRGVTGPVGARQAQESSVVALAQARAQARANPRKVAPGNELTEVEADALLDQETESADMVAPLFAGGEDDQGRAA